MPSFKVTEVISENEIAPVTVDFQNGKLNCNRENNLRCELLENTKNRKRSAVVFNNDILYHGEILDEDDMDENTFIAIKNNKTNEIRLIKTNYAILKANIPKKREVLDSSLTESNTTSLQLNKEFGSKKSKRNTEQLEKMKTNIDNVKEDLEKTVANISINDTDLIVETVDNSWVPPINRAAPRVSDVYDLNNFLTSSELECLTEEAIKLLSEDCDDLYTVPIIKSEILKLRPYATLTESQRKCKILLYVHCLIKFLKTLAKDIQKRNYSVCSFSQDIHKKILDSFTTLSANGRTRPNNMRDKCICYIMVLMMLGCDYKLCLTNLSKEIKCGVGKLQELGKHLGFSPAGADKSVLTLKIPVPPPPSSNSKYSKRKK